MKKETWWFSRIIHVFFYLGGLDILVLGRSSIKWMQRLDMAIAVDWDVKHQMKQTYVYWLTRSLSLPRKTGLVEPLIHKSLRCLLMWLYFWDTIWMSSHLYVGRSPIKRRQRPNKTTTFDWGVKLRFKQTNKQRT